MKSRLLGKQGPIELHSTFLQCTMFVLSIFCLLYITGIRFSLVIDLLRFLWNLISTFVNHILVNINLHCVVYRLFFIPSLNNMALEFEMAYT